MKIELVKNLLPEEHGKIKQLVGEAFVTNELFHNWGTLEERHDDVIKYMDYYVEYVYQSKALYSTEDKTGYIGLMDSKNAPTGPQLKMLLKMFRGFKFSKIKSLLSFIKQIENGNAKYAKSHHLDILMVCVDKGHQGKGIATSLVNFAKQSIPQFTVAPSYVLISVLIVKGNSFHSLYFTLYVLPSMVIS